MSEHQTIIDEAGERTEEIVNVKTYSLADEEAYWVLSSAVEFVERGNKLSINGRPTASYFWGSKGTIDRRSYKTVEGTGRTATCALAAFCEAVLSSGFESGGIVVWRKKPVMKVGFIRDHKWADYPQVEEVGGEWAGFPAFPVEADGELSFRIRARFDVAPDFNSSAT